MKNKEKTETPKFVWLIVLLLAVVAILFIYAKVLMGLLTDYPERGQFGDMFGALNAAFSGLAFAAVVYAIFLQRRELELQRKELELAREEYKRIADAQVAAQRLQLLSERIKATRSAIEDGKAAFLQLKENLPNDNTKAWATSLELMLAAQAQRLVDLFEKLDELEENINNNEEQ